MANKIEKVVIFAGGRGTRLSEFTDEIPKPLVLVNGEPIILHIMRQFYRQGYKEFILALGYKSLEFKKFFQNYSMAKNDVTFDSEGIHIHENSGNENWTIHLVETGLDSSTGQRLHNIRKYLNGDPFFMTYGDSMSDVDLDRVEEKLFESENLATITAVSKGERFGILDVDGDGNVQSFQEKNTGRVQLINGGFIACRNGLLNYVNSKTGDLSFEILSQLSNEGRLGSYRHEGFWKAMDTKRDVDEMEEVAAERPELFN